MHDIAKRGMAFAVTTGGLLLAGAGIASADATATTGGGGVLSGNAVQLPAVLGLNACGDQVGVLSASGSGAATSCSIADSAPSATAMTSSTMLHSGGVLSGNAVQLPIDVPINLCGDSVLAASAAVSAGSTNCAIGSASSSTSSTSGSMSGGAAGGTTSSGGIASTGSGIGTSTGSGSSSSSSSVSGSTSGSSSMSMSSSGSSAFADTTGAGGVLSGNAIQLPIDVPVNICGNLVSVIGVLTSVSPVSCTEGAPAPMPSTSPSGTPSPTPSTSSSSSPTTSPTPSSSVSLSGAQGPIAIAPGQIGAVQPLAPNQPVADPIVFWPRPGTVQHVNMPQRAVPARVTCDVEPSAHTEALGVGPGGALGTVGATAAAFASGTGLRALGRRRHRRH